MNTDCQWITLTAMCGTRWVKNHNSLLKFKDLYKPVLASLQELSDDRDMETSSKAAAYIKALLNGEFIVTLFLVQSLLQHSHFVKDLTVPTCNLRSASDQIENIVERFKNMRENIKNDFSALFNKAKALQSDVGEKIKILCLTPTQRHHFNVQSTNPKQYSTIAVAIPLLEDCVNQLDTKFLNHKKKCL